MLSRFSWCDCLGRTHCAWACRRLGRWRLVRGCRFSVARSDTAPISHTDTILFVGPANANIGWGTPVPTSTLSRCAVGSIARNWLIRP